MTTGRRRPMLSLRRRDRARWSNVHAAWLTAAGVAVFIAVAIFAMVRHDRWLYERRRPFTVPWDPAWPSLPVVLAPGALAVDLAQAVYAVAATNAEVLQYIPCYCGCRSEGHLSNLDCYVKHREADGRVSEWDGHGRICPVGPDITGDAVYWSQNAKALSAVRADIALEFSSRGPATPTPPVPNP